MGLIKPWLAITVVILALAVGGMFWYGESHPPVPVEKPQPVAAAPVVTPPAAATPVPSAEVSAPVAEVAGPVVAATQPAKVSRSPEEEAAETARRDAKDRKLIARRYAQLFEQLGLNPEQREQLTRLLIDDREASVDYASASAALGVDASEDPDAFASSVHDMRQEIKEQVKGLLGDDGYAKFRAGEETIKQTAVVDSAQKALKETGARLSKTQANQLQGVLQNLGVHYVNDDVIARASGFLTEPQLEVLQQQASRRANGAAKDRVQKAIKKNKT